MLDPRIYRAAFVPVALALVALAFSLYNQQGPLGTSLAPDAFNGQNAFSTMNGLSQAYPSRRPGSPGDDALAGDVARTFARHSLSVTTDVSNGRTADGTRPLETVTGVLPGFSSQPIVVVAHRDSLHSPGTSELSGTATLLELARVLSGRTLNRTVILASTSGSTGAAGAVRLARKLAGSVDAVLVLGDLAGSRLRPPVIVPWSDGQGLAPPMLRNTVAAALGAQAALRPGGLSLGGQFAHLAFPLSSTEQGAFGELGEPSVLLSATGEHTPAADAAVSADRLTAFGRTALQTVSALEDGGRIPSPSAYLIYDNKVVPAWAVRLLVLTLILPVLAAGIDGYARARRRGHAVGRWSAWVLAGAVPFALSALLVLALKLTGLMHVAPPEPVDGNLVAPHAAGIAILVGMAFVLALSFAVLRRWLARLAGARGEPSNEGTAVALPLVMCAVTLAIWVENPFAAALVLPALNIWVWLVAPDTRLRNPVRLVLLLAGIAAPVLVVVYYAVALGLGPVSLAWSGVLMLAGGHIGVVTALEWSILLGCTASVATIALRAVPLREVSELPVTVRGPVTYAGPGSLGGTESALRR
jgi:hypothetical protein